ncbi:MAG: hypothetical protein J0H64_02135 [Actinobacteria bacterium]|nr:hypothetical protein [Actinomycetota bacterium]
MLSAGCAAADPLTPDDRRAIGELATIAPRDAGIDIADGTIESGSTESGTIETSPAELGEVECWQPSASLVDAQSFRVICRVHYSASGDQRYRDMICIGDPDADPVSEYCYLWAYYSDMPVYEDKTGYFAS